MWCVGHGYTNIIEFSYILTQSACPRVGAKCYPMRGDTFLDTLARVSSCCLHDVSCSYYLDLDRVLLDPHKKHDRASSTMV
jgi:hypothetical protein